MEKKDDSLTPQQYAAAKQNMVHVIGKHASDEVKLHCVHCWMFLGYKKKDIAALYAKDRHRIGIWIRKFQTTVWFMASFLS
jgi:hypothetical protein